MSHVSFIYSIFITEYNAFKLAPLENHMIMLIKILKQKNCSSLLVVMFKVFCISNFHLGNFRYSTRRAKWMMFPIKFKPFVFIVSTSQFFNSDRKTSEVVQKYYPLLFCWSSNLSFARLENLLSIIHFCTYAYYVSLLSRNRMVLKKPL